MLQNISILSSMTQHKFGVFSRTQIQEKKKKGGEECNRTFTSESYFTVPVNILKEQQAVTETEDTNTLSHSCLLKFIFDE